MIFFCCLLYICYSYTYSHPFKFFHHTHYEDKFYILYKNFADFEERFSILYKRLNKVEKN